MMQLLVFLALYGLDDHCTAKHNPDRNNSRLEVHCNEKVPLKESVKFCKNINPVYQPPYKVYMVLDNGIKFYCSEWENYNEVRL